MFLAVVHKEVVVLWCSPAQLQQWLACVTDL